MRLHLVNDLPLFRRAIGGADPMARVRETIVVLAETVPATLTFVDYPELELRWHDVLAGEFDHVVLVGTRPPLLTSRARAGTSGSMRCVMTRRVLDENGRTATVQVINGTNGGDVQGRLLIADDVAMSGETLLAVLQALNPRLNAASIPVARAAIATRRALDRVRAEGVDATAAVTLDYEPIVEGTVIFVHDLLYGKLRGVDFLAQVDLLRPFLGDGLAPVRELRRNLDAITIPRRPVVTLGRP